MARSIKVPLISGGLLIFFWGAIGIGVIMGLADQPRELPRWREVFADILIWLVLAYFPLYFAMLFTSLVLKQKKKEVAAYRASMVPFLVPAAAVVLLGAYFAIPGAK